MKYTNDLPILLIFAFIIEGNAATETSTCDTTDDVSHFKRATESRHFVDKTNLLKVFLHHERPSEVKDYAWDDKTRAIAFACPNGFGKTTNLDMARRFFQLPFDQSTGQKLDKKSTNNYKLFTNKSLNLEIAQDPNFVEEHFGEYPMIYLDFSNIQGNTTDEIITSMRKRMGRVMKEYRWLCIKTRKENENPTDQRLKQHLNIFKKIFKQTANASEFVHALEGLAELLAKNFNKSRIMVLIDAFDTPITHAIINKIKAQPIYDYTDLIIKTFVAYKLVPCHVMIVGQRDTYLDGWNCAIKDTDSSRLWIKTIKRNQFLRFSTEFRKYFGFTDTDVDRLLTASNVDKNERERIQKYFNGYKFVTSKNTSMSNISLYHPEGVLQYLQTTTIKDYYLGTNSLAPHVMKCLRHEDIFNFTLKLLTKQTKSSSCDGPFLYNYHLSFLADLVRSNYYYYLGLGRSEKILFESGYLSFTDSGIRIPNKMAYRQFKRDMNKFFFDAYGINVTNSYVTSSIKSILKSTETTDEMLINLAHSLQQMINSTKINNLEKFQFLSIMFGTLINHWDHDKEVEMEYANERSAGTVKQDIDTLMLRNRDKKNALFVRVFYKFTLEEAINRGRDLVPAGWPRRRKDINVLKYLAINLNQMNQVEVGKGENREKNT